MSISAPQRPIDVPPYSVQTILSEANIGISDQSVRVAQAFGNELYVGFSQGELARFALVPESESYTILSRQTLPGGKPVEDIVLVSSLQRALVLCDNQIHILTLPNLDPVNIKPIRHIVCMAVDQLHLLRPAPTQGMPIEPVQFCAIKRGTIALYSLRGDRLLFMKEIPLPDGATLARRSGFTLCIANKVNYQIIDLETASAMDIIPVSQAFDPPPFIVTPSITAIEHGEFLILSFTGVSTLGLFINSNGDPVRGTLEWTQHPLSLNYDYPYITSLLPNDTIEVHSVENQAIQQVVAAPASGNHRKRIIAAVHGYAVPSSDKGSKMKKVSVSLMRGPPVLAT
ncbi:hypothetical protein CYLTODRAFT_408022 [Cylindrobasidium torrendii FP15055 ss-10]|uniref:CNH domain-containing protein n=1 Tax=Cylindrobasidium torrendii FP15055 ss-10 TaxID=1314674 RepID=A0A0D7BME9_9AGAR|nr:hypothetical protein CYLTODRAFT_408022 [Cylindrobasidium torrendii FP15055 ss-10]